MGKGLSSEYKRGITLTEFSITVVVIGLVVMFIMLGQSTDQQATIRETIVEANKYLVAVDSFRGKYKELPGDMPNAREYWPGGGCMRENIMLCTGNGDGLVRRGVADGEPKEDLEFWRQLGLAGLIKEELNGISVRHSRYAIGKNIPVLASISKSVGVSFYYWPDCSRTADTCDNHFTIGKQWGDALVGDTFSPSEMQSIDAKMDDGIAMTGRVVADGTPIGTPCVNAKGHYDMETFIPACAMVMFLDARAGDTP